MTSPQSVEYTQEQIKKIAQAGRVDFFFFCTRILAQTIGFESIQVIPHKWMCDIAQHWTRKKKLILTPRDTFKTTVLVVAYAIWRIINNPQISILLTSNTEKNSRKSLNAIKAVFERAEFFKICYGELIGEPWTTYQVSVSTRAGAARTYTIEISGADTSVVGSHYDLILFDDPHYELNINTMEQIEKVIQYYRGLLMLLDSKTGQLCITATRWHHLDINNYLISEESDLFDIYVKSAYKEVDGKKVFFFPSRQNEEYLERRKRELGSHFFSCQCQNDPTDEDTTLFKAKYFKNFVANKDNIVYKLNKDSKHAVLTPLDSLKFFISMDPAGRGNLTEQRRLDYTGLVVVGIDEANRWFVFEAIRRQGLMPSDMIAMLFERYVKYKPAMIGIESTTWQGQIKEGFERECKTRNIWPPVMDLLHHNRNKGQRIKGLQPIYVAGDVYHVAGLYDLEMELLKFTPKSSIHDDIIDSLAYIKDIAFAPEKSEVKKVVMPELHESPDYLISATEAWREYGRGTFSEFMEDWTPDEEETTYKRSAIME